MEQANVRFRTRQICRKNIAAVPSDYGIQLLTDVRYGPSPRNTMDIYSPPKLQPRPPTSPWPDDDSWHEPRPHACSSNVPRPLAPVVVYVHGGVWATGSKWHYTAMAARLCQAGSVVCVLEYSLYPSANSDCMVREVSDAMTYVMDNAERYGGDAAQVTLFGHSAGAHLCFMALLHRAAAAAKSRESTVTDDGALCTTDSRMPARTLLAAGPYDISKHYEYEERRGVHMLSTMERAIGGWAAFRARSPAVIIASVINMHAERMDAAAPRLAESASALRPTPAAVSGAAVTMAELGAVNRGKAELAGVGAMDVPAPVEVQVAVIAGDSVNAEGDRGERAVEAAVSVAVGDSEMSAAPQGSSGSAGGSEAVAYGRGMKRPRPDAEGEEEAPSDVVPEVETLNPPGRERFFDMFPLAGDAIAARAGHLSAADAGADGADAGTGTAVMLDGEAFQADAEDAAERFAAGLALEDIRRLPPVVLMCSSRDSTVPWHESAEMFHVLRAAGVRARHLMYDDVGHAGFVMEWRAVRDASGLPAGADGGAEPAGHPKFMRDTIRLVKGEVNI